MKQVRFATFSKEEEKHVDLIVARALMLFDESGLEQTIQDIEMDLSATHAACPLDLEKLAEADDFNFAHDIRGIYHHLNRKTGELENCFSPRSALPEKRPQNPLPKG